MSELDQRPTPARDEWVVRLTGTGPERELALAELHQLMIRAARHQISRMPSAVALGAARREEAAHSAADEATLAVLDKVHTFEGRSRFTTWAYKFAILQANVEVRRASWREREVDFEAVAEPSEPHANSPEAHVEGSDLAQAVRRGLDEALTPHQRRVAQALIIDEVPIDVLAERMDTNRNALYKTLHDVRKRLRAHLNANGFHTSNTPAEVLS